MSFDLQEIIETRLQRFNPTTLTVQDDSSLHLGHEGAKSGGKHFSVQIVSEQFSGVSLVKRHQLIYEAMGELMKQEIHALKIKACTPNET